LGDAVMRNGLSDLYGSHSLVNKDAAVGHLKSNSSILDQKKA
jgi:hypothetical protein